MVLPKFAMALLLPIAAFTVGTAQAATYAYVGNAGSNDISVFRFDPATGEMTPVEAAPFGGVTGAGPSTPLAVSPDRRFLFAGVRVKPYQALSYAIDPKTGRLTEIGGGALADSMANIATDRTGRFLFSASYGGNKVAVNPIGPDGKVGAPLQVIPTGIKAHSIQPSPDNRYVFATNLGSDQVLAFRFDAATGRLTPNTPPRIPVKTGPRHFLFHPNHRFVYLIDELDGIAHVFAYNAAKGSWRQIQQLSALPAGFTGTPWTADIHITPDGAHLYTSDRTTSTLAIFAVDARTGRLTAIGNAATEKQPRGFNIDQSGRYLAAVGELSNGMSVYAIDPQSGALKWLKSYRTGKQPNWVEFVSFP